MAGAHKIPFEGKFKGMTKSMKPFFSKLELLVNRQQF
jgi:hypothetical protein